MTDPDSLLLEDAARWRRAELPAPPDLDALIVTVVHSRRVRPRRGAMLISVAATLVIAVAVLSLVAVRGGGPSRPSAASACAASTSLARDCAVALSVARAHLRSFDGPVGSDGWPAGLKLVTVASASGTVTDSNTGATCTSGKLVTVQMWGSLHGIAVSPPGAPASGSAEAGSASYPPIGLDLTADAVTGRTCELGVFATGAPLTSTGRTVVYPARPAQVGGSIREIGGPAPGINRRVPGNVTITSDGSTPVRTVTTTRDGTFEISLPPGRYDFQATTTAVSGAKCLAQGQPVAVGAGRNEVTIVCAIP